MIKNINKKIKIAYLFLPEKIFDSGLVKSGSVIANQQIVAYLQSQGFEVIKFYPKDLGRIGLQKCNGLGNLLMFQDILKQVDDINKCDVVISTNYYGAILPEIKKPIITIFHHSAKSLLAMMQSKDRYKDKTYIKWRNKAKKFDLAYDNDELIHDQVTSIVEDLVIKQSSKLVVVSQQLGRELVDRYGAKKDKLCTIHNSFPSSWEENFTEKSFCAKKLGLISVTRMPASDNGFFMKGIDRMLHIFSKTKNYNLKLVASTSKAEQYQNFLYNDIKGLKVFLNLAHDKVGAELSESHVSIHCSRIESYGLSVIESMAMGNIVVSYPEGVVPEIIKNGKNGFIVRSSNEMQKVLKFINHNRASLSDISKAARITALENNSSSQFEKYVSLINELTNR